MAMLDGEAGGARMRAVMEAIERRIASRAVSAGDKLPSIRRFAETMNVSPSTVVAAYDQLVADGVITARRGAGFFVADAVKPFALAETGPAVEREIDPFWVARQSLDADPQAPKPGCGWMPADWMPIDALRRAVRRLARTEAEVLVDYGSTRGPENLRKLLARQFAEEGLSANPEQILLTAAGTQSIDLICRYFLKPGDTVVVDDPCYFNFHALLRAHQVKIVGVPALQTGPDCEAFEAVLTRHKPKLYITTSAPQNPTGASPTPPTVHRLLSLAAAHDLIIVEDAIFAGFEPDAAPGLAVLDGLDRVVRIGSFSKTLSASVRCGFIAARPDWIEGLIDLQVATHFGGPSPVAAELVFGSLSDGSYRKHMEALRLRLAKRRREVAARLSDIGIEAWLMPKGGFYLWCRLPEGTDSALVARRALEDGLVLGPGNVFSVSQGLSEFMRFNVSQMHGPGIYRRIARALETR
ncbi:aminotransferase-like domain-containing protein [Cucumibacter marinus]|uniref:aminotransferase-like domain-containing protein n=1 Tax=Cucumibacter marinus TaxID=1121252 RepID=UPI000418CD34|nr:PLP-dependent aminotransferase family protein [Cucumibacter marinus]